MFLQKNEITNKKQGQLDDKTAKNGYMLHSVTNTFQLTQHLIKKLVSPRKN